jgi:molybdopterin-containing oxidoreductase family iron-sulfur binding subunit
MIQSREGERRTMARYGLIVDVERCSGCMTCVIACKQENLTEPGVSWNRVFEVEIEASNQIAYFRYGCMHCDNPPCAAACPEKAIYMSPEGIVLIDYDKCEGHGACARACPYQVIDIPSGNGYFVEPAPFEKARTGHRGRPPGKPSMCTFCSHRLEEGREPACVEGCPSKAMIFGDIDDPQSPVGKRVRESEPLLPQEKTNPKVSYLASKSIIELIENKALEKLKL